MPHPNVTIRHARSAVHLVLSGAVRDIEAEFADDEKSKEDIVNLFDEVADEIDQWGIEPSIAFKLNIMLSEMQAEMGSNDAYREILGRFNLFP